MDAEIREEYVKQLLEKIIHRSEASPAAKDEAGGRNLAGGLAPVALEPPVSGPAPIDSEPPSVGGQRKAGTDAPRDSQEPASDAEVEDAKQSGESELMLVVDQEYVQILREYDVSDDKMNQDFGVWLFEYVDGIVQNPKFHFDDAALLKKITDTGFAKISDFESLSLGKNQHLLDRFTGDEFALMVTKWYELNGYSMSIEDLALFENESFKQVILGIADG